MSFNLRECSNLLRPSWRSTGQQPVRFPVLETVALCARKGHSHGGLCDAPGCESGSHGKVRRERARVQFFRRGNVSHADSYLSHYIASGFWAG
jgi:hypothetical protein